MSIIPGTRCRSTRTIVFPGGFVRRSTPGTLVSQRENLGRELFTVDFDSGQKVILFAHEIELAGAAAGVDSIQARVSGVYPVYR